MNVAAVEECIRLLESGDFSESKTNEQIAYSLGWTSHEHPDRTAEDFWMDPGGVVAPLPQFTTSLIDAMSVLPNGTKLDMVLRADGTGYACVWTKHGCRSTSQDTLTKALLIVALKACILQEV